MNITSDPSRRKEEKKLSQMSPFEIKNRLINLAKADARKSTSTFLNAGRGNPNWIATEPRDAFFLLGKFGMQECRRVYEDPVGLAGIPSADGMGKRFETFLAENDGQPGANLLKGAYDYLINIHNADPDELAKEWVEAIIGDQYPTPDRILKHTEIMLRDYLRLEMGGDPDTSEVYDLFATEGGTAGMCYAFDSLQENFLIEKGDKMALMVPIFTPYIEIPQLDRFSFEVINISANSIEQPGGYHTWQYPPEELDKLRDPSVKLLCLVNPSNPPSYTLAPELVEQLVDIVENDNPGLMFITDDVYGTFVKDFHSLMYRLPHNTICVYSFSKYFGATGWRLAVTAINRDNIFDRKIAALPEDKKADLARRYGSLSTDPSSIRFIDRMVADSRLVALNHTAGLSTPQQIQMTLMAAFSLLPQGVPYKAKMREIITERLEALWQNTGFTLVVDPLRAGYYSEIDIMLWARKFYGDDFAAYLKKNYEPLDFVIRLAESTAVVLLNGDGFDGPAWSVRASLANLDKDDYKKIGGAIRGLLDEYHEAYLNSVAGK